MYCNKCQMIGMSGKFCRYCGEGLIEDEMHCPHCDESVYVVSKFCNKCGRPIQEEVKASIEAKLKERKGGE